MQSHNVYLTGFTVLALLLGGHSLTANAATWHKGTPANLRGTYASKKIGYRHGVKRGDYTIDKMYLQPKGAPFYTWSYLNHKYVTNSSMMGMAVTRKYKKVGKHTYRLVGDYKNGGGSTTMLLRSYRHHRIRFTFSKSFKGTDYLHRTRKQSNFEWIK